MSYLKVALFLLALPLTVHANPASLDTLLFCHDEYLRLAMESAVYHERKDAIKEATEAGKKEYLKLREHQQLLASTPESARNPEFARSVEEAIRQYNTLVATLTADSQTLQENRREYLKSLAKWNKQCKAISGTKADIISVCQLSNVVEDPWCNAFFGTTVDNATRAE